jgi:plastin-1
MKNDAHLWHVLPADPASHIIHAVYDGVLLCKLVNFAVPGTLDDRVVNLIPLTSVDVEQNFNLCLNSARAIGCIVHAANATELSQAEESLNLIYELIKVSVLNPLNLSNHPEFSRLKDSRESISQLANLPPIKILERWISFHLQIHFTFDNAKALSVAQCVALITKLSPHTPTYSDESERCEWFINTAKIIIDGTTDVLCDDVGALLTNPRIQVLLLAQIAHKRSGISPLAEPEESAVKTALADNDSDPEGSREERAFSMWINSLGIGHYVTNLQQDTRDGIVLLKILDKIQPGCVNWKDVNMNPNNPYKMLENCNKSLVVGKKMNFSLVSIDGKDLFDGNRKLILAFVWQACKHHLLSVLRGCGGEKGELTENDVLSWAKDKLQRVEKPSIASFRDPALRTARPLLEVLASVAPAVVQWKNVISNPQTDEECLMNARYVVGLARKIGCFVFCVPEDIFDVKPKMIITFLASLMWYDNHKLPSYVKS